MNSSLSTVVMIVQVISALVIVGLVLLQHGKGADMGASFGSGASGSLFGATGSSNFLSKSTAVAVAVFFVATLILTSFGANKAPSVGVMDNLPAKAVQSSSAAASTATSAAVVGSASSAASQTSEIPK
ncbi:preprotein translocase subunit SecG [Undibacterium fentianense]|uniref:Protein-export membrane protein SecG n=1 Tax=Undibacterium fentianense TaxID=2828728 RepID=A0A941ICH3_9BURK|nr:preprotein translocase subunit SecG [Undibacterium fentianense]MBR7800194.1 preprotein translocase subunit SecG [Undibacterium fentianense]